MSPKRMFRTLVAALSFVAARADTICSYAANNIKIDGEGTEMTMRDYSNCPLDTNTYEKFEWHVHSFSTVNNAEVMVGAQFPNQASYYYYHIDYY